eukprot:TRINITY_DN65845_c2_g8_i1.p1 TRINITY_DN65845_c2_g8~~TRINITY_DN65845_c2_g8_i1.p1  ORF type:complete len:435 (+),score=53.61 TRINITY_DN65845_c2_g8_i1:41-1306(+)
MSFYLAPNTTRLQHTRTPPPCPPACTRIVCISDTHNEHHALDLPHGDILVHAGDVLTESGLRHVKRGPDGTIKSVNPEGTQLFERFAEWFGALPHRHKIVIGGNHDLVLEGLGPKKCQKILDHHCPDASARYLCHEAVDCDGVKVFGSPYGSWGSHNDAFMLDPDYTDMPNGVDVMITHKPCILPKKDEKHAMATALSRTGAKLHVSGHCHWANGLYYTKAGIPCVVASICGSWKSPCELGDGRGDPEWDNRRGGYSTKYPPIVVDIPVAMNVQRVAKVPTNMGKLLGCSQPQAEALSKPKLLVFCPSNDAETAPRLMNTLSNTFDCTHFAHVDDAIAAFQHGERFNVAICKLGVQGNLGVDVMEALRSTHTNTPVSLIVHSATAAKREDKQAKWRQQYGVELFVDHGCEDVLYQHLAFPQ